MSRYISEHLSAGGTYIEVVYPERTTMAFVGSLAPRRDKTYKFKTIITKFPSDKKYTVSLMEWMEHYDNYVQVNRVNRKRLSAARRRAEKWTDRLVDRSHGRVRIRG